MRTNARNWFATTLTSQVGAESLNADVESTGDLPSPAYIVFNPRSSTQREVWLADGTFTSTRFVTSSLAKRYLRGSAAGSGLSHDAGVEVWSVPLEQNLDDLWDEVDAKADTTALTSGLAGKASDPHGNEAHDPNFATEAALATKADLSGATFTGEVVAPDVRFGLSSIASTGTVTLNFAGDGFNTHALTGNIVYASSNLATGRSVSVRVVCDATIRTLAFPASWTFVSPKPTEIAANKTGVLTVTSFGTTDADVVAAWAVQE